MDYLADAGWTKITVFGFLDGISANFPSSLQISGTDEDAIFQSDKYGMVTYKVRLPNDTYNIKLLFAEKYFNAISLTL